MNHLICKFSSAFHLTTLCQVTLPERAVFTKNKTKQNKKNLKNLKAEALSVISRMLVWITGREHSGRKDIF
jgi:hypothetical protein